MSEQVKQERIQYIDGLRGFLAVKVIVLHAFEVFGFGLGTFGIVSNARLEAGLFSDVFSTIYHYALIMPFAVEGFLVISGYGLMMAIAQSQDKQIKGGLKSYFKRRAKRIWTPYYAALVITLLIIAFVPTMNQKTNTYWDLALPAFDPSVIGSHMLFIHNWTDTWRHTINPPFWSIAVNEQIYLVFPLLLLPAWRRFGIVGMMAIAAVVGIGIMLVIPDTYNPRTWYLILFALGASAAAVSFGRGRIETYLREHLSSRILTVMAIVCIAAGWLWTIVIGAYGAVGSTLLGAGIAAAMIEFTKTWKNKPERTGGFYRFFASPQMVRLGTFSFSLYLMHAPLLALFGRVVIALELKSVAAYSVVFLIGIPLVVLGCYLFHLLFERPFMPPSALNWRSRPTSSSHNLPHSQAASAESRA